MANRSLRLPALVATTLALCSMAPAYAGGLARSGGAGLGGAADAIPASDPGSVLTPAGPVRTTPPDPAMTWVKRWRPVVFDRSKLGVVCQGSAELPTASGMVLNLFDGVVVQVSGAEASRDPASDSVAWHGALVGQSGEVDLTVEGACVDDGRDLMLTGTVVTDGHVYSIDPTGSGTARVEELSRAVSESPAGTTDEIRDASPDPHAAHAAAAARSRAATAAPDAIVLPALGERAAPAVIDLLALYTPRAMTVAGGASAAQSKIRAAVNLANQVLVNSGVNAKVRLVGIEQAVGYTGSEAPTESGFSLRDFAAGRAGVNTPALRLRYHAAIVSLFTAAGGGIGFMPVWPSPKTVDDGFDAENIQYYSYGFLAHELGHNMGADHDWLVSPSANNREFPGNHGYVAPSKKWHTIMAYADACNFQCDEVLYYSSPDRAYEGEVMGVRGSGPGASDVSGFLNLTAQAVADYPLDLYPLPGQPSVFRLFGNDRYTTGVVLADRSFNAGRPAGAVVLARGDGFADALAGVPLADKKGGPLLLTTPGALPPVVGDAIRRLLPSGRTVYILGGAAAVSSGVEGLLRAWGYQTVRLGGADRFGTALSIARDPRAMADPPNVVVATGDNFPDALAAGPFATLPDVDAAIVLSDDRVFDGATAAYVRGKRDVIAVGGQADAAAVSLGRRDGVYAYAGHDRSDTAAQVASGVFRGGAPIGVATGTGFADALTGGAFMARHGGPILLTDPAVLPTYTASRLRAARPTVPEIEVFGGGAAIADATAGQIVTAVGGQRRF